MTDSQRVTFSCSYKRSRVCPYSKGSTLSCFYPNRSRNGKHRRNPTAPGDRTGKRASITYVLTAKVFSINPLTISYILTIAFLAMSALVPTGANAGLVGLVLSYVLNITSSLVGEPVLQCPIILRQERLGSAFRLNRILLASNAYYTKNLKLPHEILDARPDGLWPSQGAVEFR
jgi:hypothetical protein